jgi:hypothetical protein
VKLSGGKGVYYTRQNWLRRWLAEGPASGWAILVEN